MIPREMYDRLAGEFQRISGVRVGPLPDGIVQIKDEEYDQEYLSDIYSEEEPD